MKLYIVFVPELLNEDELHVLLNIPESHKELEIRKVNTWSGACSLARSLVISEPNRKAVVARRADGPNHAQEIADDLKTLVQPAGFVILVNGLVTHYEPSGYRE